MTSLYSECKQRRHGNRKKRTHVYIRLYIQVNKSPSFFLFPYRTPKVTHLFTTQYRRNGTTCWLSCWTTRRTSHLPIIMASMRFTTLHYVEIQGEWTNVRDISRNYSKAEVSARIFRFYGSFISFLFHSYVHT